MFLGRLDSLARSVPPQVVRVHSQERASVLCTLHVLFDQLGGHTYHMLALPVLDHVERLQCTDDVFLSDAGHHTVCVCVCVRV